MYLGYCPQTYIKKSYFDLDFGNCLIKIIKVYDRVRKIFAIFSYLKYKLKVMRKLNDF